MTETTSRTATETPTVRMVCDLGPGQQLNAVANALVDVSTTMECLYRFQPYFRDPSAEVRSTLLDVGLLTGWLRNEPPPDYIRDVLGPKVFGHGDPFIAVGTAHAGPQVRHLNYRNPLEAWLDLAEPAVFSGIVVSSSIVLPRFTDFVVGVGSFLRDYGADRRVRIAEAREAEARADVASAQARRVTSRAGLGDDEVDGVQWLRETLMTELLDTNTIGAEPTDVDSAVEQRVSLEESAAMLRVGDVLTDFQDVTGQDPPSVVA